MLNLWSRKNENKKMIKKIQVHNLVTQQHSPSFPNSQDVWS